MIAEIDLSLVISAAFQPAADLNPLCSAVDQPMNINTGLQGGHLIPRGGRAMIEVRKRRLVPSMAEAVHL
jgi:hypothetical protein